MKLDELLGQLAPEQYEEFMDKVRSFREAVDREKAQEKFMDYVRMMWPGFVAGRHHAVMAKKFEAIARGESKRLIINMAPRHTKSEFASYLLPSWFLGKYPSKKVIQCSNTAELAVGFGRKVRNLVGSEQYKTVFPNVALRQDSKAAGRWSTNGNGEYFAIGVGGTVTGKGADLLIIDDPHSEQEAALGDPTVFDRVYEWYTSGPRQRLQPGGSIVIVMCMTGDTKVLMADGTEKLLAGIRPGDRVATFDSGKLTTSKVNNWQSNGIDSIYKIRTESGKIIRANERHPFLVMNEGVLEWTRLNQLMVGDELVSLKDASVHQGQKQSQGYALPVCQKSVITEKTQMLQDIQLGIMESGRVYPAPNAKILQCQKGYVTIATEKNTCQSPRLKKQEKNESNTGMGLQWLNTSKWFKTVTTGVMSAVKSLLKRIQGHIGTESFVSTTTTIQEKLEGFYATTATLPLVTGKRQAFLNELHRISDFTIDQIVSITPDGKEEVFDVEIDRTENFIANGVVSHNTRWSERDLTGRIIKDALSRDKGEEWEVIELPAIMPSGNPLWPEFWSINELEALREELPPSKWNAQYQQNPTGEEGALVKREWWRVWEGDNAPACEFIIQSWDTAFTKNERSDYSACTTWGIFNLNEDPNDKNIILLDAFKKRMEFPELKQVAHQFYKEWMPDSFVIEAKAAGSPLIFELRQMGIIVTEYTPTRGNDKFVRLNSVTDLFKSGKVWCPDTRWASEVVEEMAAFPNAEHDDLVDSSVQALIRFRKGGFLRLHTDEEDEPLGFRRKHVYY